jgi:hypothetical protein
MSGKTVQWFCDNAMSGNKGMNAGSERDGSRHARSARIFRSLHIAVAEKRF